MDMQMYERVKAAIQDGKSLEDVVAEVNAMAQTAKKELEPKTPMKDKYGKTYGGLRVDIPTKIDGTINKDGLVTVMMMYFTQQGLNPDECFDTEADFREHIEKILDRGLICSKAAQNMVNLERNGASDGEYAAELVDAIRQVFQTF